MARYKYKYKYSNILVFISILLLTPSVGASANSPMDLIRESNEDILRIYQTSPAGEFSEEILTIMEKVTDFDTMADRAVEQICQQQDKEPCARLKKTFIQLLKLNATRKLGRYRADRFDYISEKISPEQAIVKTVAYYADDSLELDYILEKRANKWVVVNYIVDEIDTIKNYQRQFKRITQKKSLPFLIKRLETKNELYQSERENLGNKQ